MLFPKKTLFFGHAEIFHYRKFTFFRMGVDCILSLSISVEIFDLQQFAEAVLLWISAINWQTHTRSVVESQPYLQISGCDPADCPIPHTFSLQQQLELDKLYWFPWFVLRNKSPNQSGFFFFVTFFHPHLRMEKNELIPIWFMEIQVGVWKGFK